MQHNSIANHFYRLGAALTNRTSNTYRLQMWSRFIRARDGSRCVLCHSIEKLSAHHIIRKSFWKHLRFQPGNGITLCGLCHKEPHAGFNRRPNLNLPMDSEGGEKIDLLTGMMGALTADARLRNIDLDPYYNFDDHALRAFKTIQGLKEDTEFPGAPIEQAYAIWSQTPRQMLDALMSSIGVELPENFIQDEMTTFFTSKGGSSPNDVLYMRYVPPIPFKIDPTSDPD